MDDHVNEGIDKGGPSDEAEETKFSDAVAGIKVREYWWATSPSKKSEY